MDGEEEKGGGVASHGESAGKWSWRSWRSCRGEDAFKEGARSVHKQGPEDQVPFAEYGLVILTPEHHDPGGACGATNIGCSGRGEMDEEESCDEWCRSVRERC